jgi:hypothetical protein
MRESGVTAKVLHAITIALALLAAGGWLYAAAAVR